MKLSKQNRAMLDAVAKGYRIDKQGNVLYRGRKRTITIGNTGYLEMSIRLFSGDMVSIKVHRLQAFQKYGSKIFNQNLQVRHLNGNPEDNSYKNISIGTQSENMMDKPVEDRLAHSMHAASFIRKYDPKVIRADHEDGLSYTDIMIKHDISSKGTVSYIINKARGGVISRQE